MLSLNRFNDSFSSYIHKFLFWVKSYVYKACNRTILYLSISLKKISLGLLNYRPKSIIYVVFGFCYVFLLLCLCILIVCMLCSVYPVFNVPTGILRLPWLRFFHAFSSVVKQMPGYTSQRRSTVRTLPN